MRNILKIAKIEREDFIDVVHPNWTEPRLKSVAYKKAIHHNRSVGSWTIEHGTLTIYTV